VEVDHVIIEEPIRNNPEMFGAASCILGVLKGITFQPGLLCGVKYPSGGNLQFSFQLLVQQLNQALLSSHRAPD